MLSQNVFRFVSFLMVGALFLGCSSSSSEEGPDTGSNQPVDTSGWEISHEGDVRALEVESGRGDVLVLGAESVARYDADGALLFRVPMASGATRAAFSEGNAIIVLATGELLELDRTGAVVLEKNDPCEQMQCTAITSDHGRLVVVGSTIDGARYLELDPTTWAVLESVDIGAAWVLVQDVALDSESGDAFLIGGFAGVLEMPGFAQLPSPVGESLFVLRMASDGEPRWLEGFLGRGFFEARFGDEGIYISGMGRAPFTNFGGEGVVHGAFATHLHGDGEHDWTWGVHDESDDARATVDAEGRIAALYTKTVELEEERPPFCETSPAPPPACDAVSYERRLWVLDRDEFGEITTLGTTAIENAYAGRIAAAPNGSFVMAEAPPRGAPSSFPEGGFGDPQEDTPAPSTVLKRVFPGRE